MKNFTPFRLALLFVLAVAQFACAGGGTSGTGLKTFTGAARTIAGEPVAGVEVTLAGTEAMAVTDNAGNYAFETTLGAGSVQVDVANAGQVNSIEVPDLPLGDAEVRIDIEVNNETQSAMAVNVEVRPVDNERPSSPREDTPASPSPEDDTSMPVPDIEENPPVEVTLVNGVLLNIDGTPRVGAIVFSPTLGVVVTTDENGEFSIEGVVLSETLTLEIESEDGDRIESALAVDPTTSVLTLILQANEEEGNPDFAPEIVDVETRVEEEGLPNDSEMPNAEGEETTADEMGEAVPDDEAPEEDNNSDTSEGDSESEDGTVEEDQGGETPAPVEPETPEQTPGESPEDNPEENPVETLEENPEQSNEENRTTLDENPADSTSPANTNPPAHEEGPATPE